MSDQPVIATDMRIPSDVHKPELTCPRCGRKTIFYNGDGDCPSFFCLNAAPMCNFYADPESDEFREQMKQLTGVTLQDRDEQP